MVDAISHVAHFMQRGSVARLVSLLALAAPLTCATAFQRVPGDQTGVRADGNIDYLFFICSTCDKPTGSLFEASEGGVGSSGPAVIDGFGARGSGTASVDARARLIGAHSLPDLGAKATATPGIGPHPGFSEEGAYLFNALAAAQGAQYYQYLGNTEQLYTLTYTLSGSAFNLEDPPSAAGNAAVLVNGGLSLYDGNLENFELPFGQLIDSHQMQFDGSRHAFHESGSASITVAPGASFYAVAFVATSVAYFGYGSADALQTLTVTITAGDPSQLVPLLQAVPEPAGLGLMACGLVGVLLAARRRPRR